MFVDELEAKLFLMAFLVGLLLRRPRCGYIICEFGTQNTHHWGKYDCNTVHSKNADLLHKNDYEIVNTHSYL